MKNRRDFLRTLGGATAAFSFLPLLGENLTHAAIPNVLSATDHRSPDEIAQDEDFWNEVRLAYTVSQNVINLNNGGVCPQPKVVQDAMIRYYQQANELPTYYMWEIQDKGRENLRSDLARHAGCSAEEVAINRNATEALNSVIFGLPLQAGDEVILTKQDYPNMINAWKQREKRDGIKLVWLNLQLPSEDEKYLVGEFEKAITSRTKLIHLTHIINWNGQIMPARKIVEEAHKRGVEVLLDGAHSFAHFDFSLSEIGCDYFGTSLHKWLCAPFGSGMLYIRKEKIKKVWPLLSAPEPESEDIRKFENLGTRSIPIEQAIGTAVSFHEMIGIKRKEARLSYLKKYWAEKVQSLPGVKIHTPMGPGWSCAIGLFSIEGKKPGDIKSALWDKKKIHSVGIEWENIIGVRITPNVYTATKDLDKFVEGVALIAGS